MKGIGLVFAGGGGKGAYEVGVWKYLHEMELDQYVRAVSGTSVGALNAALFTGSSYELAESLWLNIEPGKILTPKKITTGDIIRWLAINSITVGNPITRTIGKMTSGSIIGLENIAQVLLLKFRTDYLFSREGLVSLINNGLNFNMLQDSNIPCFVTCLRCPKPTIERFKLNEYDDEDITQLLLASSAIPIIFPNEEFKGQKYCDGGVPIIGDNVPVQPIYDMGIENIIIIHLNRDTLIDKSMYPNSRLIEIVPSEDLGNALTGTLDFTTDGSAKRIEKGYEDAKKILKPMIEMIFMAAENQMILKHAQKKNQDFEQKKEILKEKESFIKQQMGTDEFNTIYNQLTKEK